MCVCVCAVVNARLWDLNNYMTSTVGTVKPVEPKICPIFLSGVLLIYVLVLRVGYFQLGPCKRPHNFTHPILYAVSMLMLRDCRGLLAHVCVHVCDQHIITSEGTYKFGKMKFLQFSRFSTPFE